MFYRRILFILLLALLTPSQLLYSEDGEGEQDGNSVGVLWYPSYPGMSHFKVFIGGTAYNPNLAFEEVSVDSLKKATRIKSAFWPNTPDKKYRMGFFKITLDASAEQVQRLKEVIADYQKRRVSGACSILSMKALIAAGIASKRARIFKMPSYMAAFILGAGKVKHMIGLPGIQKVEYFGAGRYQDLLSRTMFHETVILPSIFVGALILPIYFCAQAILDFVK